jgi:hypothetical protein
MTYAIGNRGVGDSGGPAGDHHDHARDRRATHGSAQRHHPAAAGGGDTRFGIAHLLRQDGTLTLMEMMVVSAVTAESAVLGAPVAALGD